MAKYLSTKTYGTDRGLSCCFRQWRATHSHCSTLHGYSLGIRLVFECDTLDDKNWCMDFGGLKKFKVWADHMFDHTLVVAHDDPMLEFFKHMNEIVDVESKDHLSSIPYERGALCDLRIVQGVGCEMFAKLCFDQMLALLEELKSSSPDRYPVNNTVRVKSAEVFDVIANMPKSEGEEQVQLGRSLGQGVCICLAFAP
jgi:6-pyruvoyltetrahydropterin/6-carboxytetrahydropterin synthase